VQVIPKIKLQPITKHEGAKEIRYVKVGEPKKYLEKVTKTTGKDSKISVMSRSIEGVVARWWKGKK